MLYFGDVEPFLIENEDVGPALRPKLLAFISDPQTKSKLQIEIAATVDWGSPSSRHATTLKVTVHLH